MISTYAQLLIAKLLDDEITESESRELVDLMVADQEVCTELQDHLLIWELWSRHCHSERSDGAFLGACLTRLHVETGSDNFVEETRKRCLDSEGGSDRTGQPVQQSASGRLGDRRDAAPSKYAHLSPEEIEKIANRELSRSLEAEPTWETFPRHHRGAGSDLAGMMERLVWTVRVWAHRGIRLSRALLVGFVVALVAFMGIIVLSRSNVAQVTQTVHARWDQNPRGAGLPRGWMRLDEGFAQIEFNKGAQVVLQAPCEFELRSSNKMFLAGGSVTASVPEEAIGFTVETSTSKIVDFGTEFGVSTIASGRSEIHVFQGRIGVGASDLRKGAPLRTVREGQAAISSEDGSIRTEAIADRPNLFVHRLPSPDQWAIPGKRLDLADLVGGGNGYGTGRQGSAIDPSTGQFYLVRRELNVPARGFIVLPRFGFIDGVFIPDGDLTGTIQVSSTGLVFTACPDTSGRSHDGLVNGAMFQHEPDPADLHLGRLKGQTYNDAVSPSIGMHANAGITFDLEALRQTLPDIEISRFQALCGISDTVARYLDGYDYGGADQHRIEVDFWVLVDGEVRFHRTLAAVSSEPEVIDLQLLPACRFLTLMTTETQGRRFCWGMFAKPSLILKER